MRALLILLALMLATGAHAQTGGRVANMKPRPAPIARPAPVVQQAIALAAFTEAPAQIFADGFEPQGAGGGEPPLDPNACNVEGVLPPGWIAITKPWVTAFSAPACITPRDPRCIRATYPNSIGTPVPIGATKGTITVIPFTALPRMTVDLTWDNVQANPAIGYPKPRPADSMFIGLSNCPGDVRAPNASSPVPWLQNGCRRIGGGASITYSTLPGQSSEYVCRLTAGQTYYLQVMAANPADGLSWGESSCSTSAVNSLLGCDVGAVHRGTAQ